MHADAIPLALQPPAPESASDVARRLCDLQHELTEAMVLFGLGRIAPDEYARRARRVKDDRLGLDALRARFP